MNSTFDKEMHPLNRALNTFFRLSKGYSFDFPFEKETVFLASSGRSGSTWIQEMLTKTDSYRVMFEPFHSYKIDALSTWNYRQYIGRDESGEEFLDVTRSILRGKIKHPWIDQDNSTLFPRKRFIKDIRANLFIAWLKKQLPHIQIIFLTRHPFSVARSRLSLGWEADLNLFLQQDRLMHKHFLNDSQYFNSISTPFGKQVAFWAIENLVPLRELSDKDALAISYEDIIKDPRIELDRIASFLNTSSQKLALDDIRRPSRTTVMQKSNETNISDLELEESFSTLVRFGLDKLYTTDEREAPRLLQRNIFTDFT